MELVGNALCLDFANTVNMRPNPTRDDLGSASRTVAWAAAVGHQLGRAEVTDLWRAEAVGLRGVVTRVFEARALSQHPDSADLDKLWMAYREGAHQAHLRPSGTSVTAQWPQLGAEALLGRVSASAVELLHTAPVERLGMCPSCGWLFHDTSRNGTRRWCSMSTCGAREKARRHYRHAVAR